jgi:hypothetical protein
MDHRQFQTEEALRRLTSRAAAANQRVTVIVHVRVVSTVLAG